MPRVYNPTKQAERWVAGMQGSSTAYKEGIQAVTESPTAKAAMNLDKAQRNYSNAISSGKTAARLNSVSLEAWKTLALLKGANNIGTGAAAAKQKYQAYVQSVAPAIQALQARIHAMPNDTPADADARQLAWSAGMREIGANRR